VNRKLDNEELNRLSRQDFRQAQKTPLTLVLDNVRSLNNVGSAFRTADAFLIKEICLCGVTGQPPNKEIEKTALGATQTVTWKHFASTLEVINDLKEKGVRVLAVEQTDKSTMLNQFEWDGQPTALVFGNEVYGVEQEVINACEGSLEIPQSGSKHSLNISVSVGIVLWELLRRRI